MALHCKTYKLKKESDTNEARRPLSLGSLKLSISWNLKIDNASIVRDHSPSNIWHGKDWFHLTGQQEDPHSYLGNLVPPSAT